MGFESEIRPIVAAHVDEIVADLERARRDLAHRQREVAELDRRVGQLEGLLALVEPDSLIDGVAHDDGMTLHEAMVVVLRDAERGLRAGDLAAEINRRRLYRMRDGRPVEAQQIHARVGNYGHLFRKAGSSILLAS